MKAFLPLLGVFMVLMGAVWFAQGLNIIITPSFMQGQIFWAVAGAVFVAIGVGLVYRAVRMRNPPTL